MKGSTFGELSTATQWNLRTHAEAHHIELAIVKRLRNADGEEGGSATDQKVADYYQPTSKTTASSKIFMWLQLHKQGGGEGFPHHTNPTAPSRIAEVHLAKKLIIIIMKIIIIKY